ncbi:hypothetical protein GTW66_00805 [Streptomyces sp. SID5473]|nr:hypothetical protein [Streptomyces sp. SID5473]MYS62721.1 hypothetical protein [Streptomyces sp. SID5473]
MRISMRRSSAIAGALLLLPLVAVSARAETGAPLSADRVAAMAPEEQARVLAPLRATADAVAKVGLGTRSDVYTQVALGSDYRSVKLYLTDVSQGKSFLAAVRRAAPRVDTGLVDVLPGRKTRKQLSAEITALTSDRNLPFDIALAGPAVDGSAIDLQVDDPAAARAHFAAPAVANARAEAEATPVRITKSTGARPLTRENDSAPFYAGAALGPNYGGRSHCTSGIPAISTWDGRQWLATAGHCYNVNDHVYTVGGNYIGQVKFKRPEIDAAFIETRTYRYTWDGVDATGYVRYLNGVRNVAVGDFTCQLGYNSKVVCNIRTVYAGNATWPVNGYNIVGSYGVPHYGGIVGRGGDSGGPVITVNDPDSRQLNGIISYGTGCNAAKECSGGVAWVDVWSVFNNFAIKLNPS